MGNHIFATYLQIPYVVGAGELAVFCGALVGASLGFLWYNAPPAMVFMGDTGSLALGGALGAVGTVPASLTAQAAAHLSTVALQRFFIEFATRYLADLRDHRGADRLMAAGIRTSSSPDLILRSLGLRRRGSGFVVLTQTTEPRGGGGDKRGNCA